MTNVRIERALAMLTVSVVALAGKAAGAPPGADTMDGRPNVSLAAFLLARTEKLKEITDSQIAKMRSLIAITPDGDPQKPEFFFRLGELCAENQRFFFAEARALDQRIFDAPTGSKAGLRRSQQRFEQQQATWLLEAVKAYVAATATREYPRLDEVLFRLAHLLGSVKKDDEARPFLLRLVKDYPTSKYIPEAFLAFAERAFDDGDMNAALRFYQKVEQFQASAVYPYAVYKMGWCQLNLGDFRAALQTFVSVAQMTQDRRVKVAEAQLRLLAREAKKDIVTAYAHIGGPDKAWEFFRRTEGDGAAAMMEGLAERYWEQGKAADSSRTYRRIMAENAVSPRLCEWQSKVLRNALSAADKRGQMQELERLAAVYERRPPSLTERRAECRTALHDAARELALIWHREAQKTQNADTYRLAEGAYRLFLAHFSGDPDGYEMTYFAGELLWVLKRWKDAAEAYTRVVEMNPTGKHLREAAHGAVLAWNNALMASADEPPMVSSEHPHRGDARASAELAPRAIPESQLNMIAALRTFRRYVPDAPEAPATIYREAYVHYDFNHFDQAATLFRELVEHHRDHELALPAASLLLDALNAQGKTREVAVWVRKFMEMPRFMGDRSFATEMVSLLSDSHDREAREYEARGDARQCGRSFAAAAEAMPDHRAHAQRLWNAAQCFQNAHLIGQAVKAWQTLIDRHPADVLAKKALFRVAAGYHQLAYYSKAADYYESFAKKYPGEPQAMAAFANATVFREGLGDGRGALADMDAFVGFFGGRNPQAAASVYFQEAEVYEAEKNHFELGAHLQRYLDRWARHGGRDREVQAHFRLGELAWRASCPRASEDGACLHVERLVATRSRQLVISASRKLSRNSRSQCGPPTKATIAVLQRTRRPAAEADQHFRKALALWKTNEGSQSTGLGGAHADERRGNASYAAAGAAFYLADREYENLIRLRFPANLDLSRPRSDSRRRLAAYLAEKTRRLETARALYLGVFKMRHAHWTIAAAARIAQLHQDFAAQLYTAEIPRNLPQVDRWGNRPRELYCNALEDQAEKIEAQAVDGFKTCLAAATRQGWYNEWSRLCERELNQLEPAQYPLASEVKPEASYAPTSISPLAVIPLSDEPAAGPAR